MRWLKIFFSSDNCILNWPSLYSNVLKWPLKYGKMECDTSIFWVCDKHTVSLIGVYTERARETWGAFRTCRASWKGWCWRNIDRYGGRSQAWGRGGRTSISIHWCYWRFAGKIKIFPHFLWSWYLEFSFTLFSYFVAGSEWNKSKSCRARGKQCIGSCNCSTW